MLGTIYIVYIYTIYNIYIYNIYIYTLYIYIHPLVPKKSEISPFTTQLTRVKEQVNHVKSARGGGVSTNQTKMENM
jgi:hypothetical protein